MDNPFREVMPEAIHALRRAYRVGGSVLPAEALVARYVRQHRGNPQAVVQFVQRAVQRGDLDVRDGPRAMEEYVRTMEKMARRKGYI